MVHRGGELLRRHVHVEGFFAVVLRGHYVEAGDTGRHRVAAGDVIVHRAYEGHLDRICARGAEVLVLPLPDRPFETVLAHVDDPDRLALIAERDLFAARDLLMDAMVEKPATVEDWPDLLARDLIAEPGLSLSAWANSHRLHPASLARGFGRQFDIIPASFRTIVRARRAIAQLVSSPASLSAVATEQGFADQAHMTRTIKRLTGRSPMKLRDIRSDQD